MFLNWSRFRFPRFLTYMLRCAFIIDRNYSYEGLKWSWERFLTISEIKIFSTSIVWGKFLKPRSFSKYSTGRNSQYLLTGSGLIKRKNDFAHKYESKFGYFGPRGPQEPEYSKFLHFPEKIRKSPLGVDIATYRFISMCEIYLYFF